jgi:nitrite reductase/ring-hydroxylating ferredoxin subunit
MTAPFVEALQADAIALGGMKAVSLAGRDVVVCHSTAGWFAIERRCGHMNAPLEQGTLVGTIVTCPMHCAQFDVRSGAALCGPMPHDSGVAPPTPRSAQLLHELLQMIEGVHTLPLRTFETRLQDGAVWVRLPPNDLG